MKGHAEKCSERYCELAQKSVDQLSKVSTLCMDDHQFTKDDFEIVGELSDVCARIVFCVPCVYMQVPRTFWSTRHFMDSQTHQLEQSRNVNGARDKRSARLRSCLKCTSAHW